ncbi:prepilin-type N-terminal cleavage/methylation domain-containing protein [Vibrio sp. SCSIO 43136]|nr:prepilin-type N-terminal cleavage/methylation domain-containing protein [Vibrio sp. SCSIO 43136]
MASNNKGFTLIESVIAIIVLGISMSVLVTTLYPRIENSASSHYQVRASALAQSFMTEILSRAYDDDSDFNGGMVRCGEGSPARECNKPLGADEGAVQDFDDVDDYIGCWYTSDIGVCKGMTPQWRLADAIGDIDAQYANFHIIVEVEHEHLPEVTPANRFKKITMKVAASRYSEFTFVAYKGNY